LRCRARGRASAVCEMSCVGCVLQFPDMHWTVEQQIAEGDKVMTRFEWAGTSIKACPRPWWSVCSGPPPRAAAAPPEERGCVAGAGRGGRSWRTGRGMQRRLLIGGMVWPLPASVVRVGRQFVWPPPATRSPSGLHGLKTPPGGAVA
jgi:hypothetical protein